MKKETPETLPPRQSLKGETSHFNYTQKMSIVKGSSEPKFFTVPNWKEIKNRKPSYQELREAYTSINQVLLQAFNWNWWVSLSTRKPMPLAVIRGRFFWWLKALRKMLGHRIELIWWAERQRRGALHIHSVISGIPIDIMLWSKAIDLWEFQHSRGKYKFGDATIKKFDQDKSGKLSWYLAKERCKDLDILEGSGSLFEKFGFSRGVRRFLENSRTEKVAYKLSQSCCRL